MQRLPSRIHPKERQLTSLHSRLEASLGPSFSVERELSGGGMAKLFLVRDASLGRRVVVKVLPHELAGGVNLDRFNREIQLLARLQHPNIVPVLVAGSADGIPYFTMPFVEGESLRSQLERHKTLPLDAIVAMLKDVASALAYAHKEGIVHRDIKPDNVLISGSAAMVTDFGVSKAVANSGGHATSTELTSIGVVVGTPAYMSPEQAAADTRVDHRSDIYSFGAMAYEMLTGRAPFANRTPQSTMAAHIHEKPAPLLRENPTVPPALADLVMRCLEKRPESRPQSADEIIAALEALPTGGYARVRRSRAPIALGLAAATILVAIAFIPRSADEPPPPSPSSASPPKQSAPVRQQSSPPAAITTKTSPRPSASGGVMDVVIPSNSIIADSLVVRLIKLSLVVSVGDTLRNIVSGRTRDGRSVSPTVAVHVADTTVSALTRDGKIYGKKPGRSQVFYTLLVNGKPSAIRDSTFIMVLPRSSAQSVNSVQATGDLARAIELYNAFNVEAARPLFVKVTTQNLPREQLALAYAYWGAAMAVLAARDSAVLLLRKALELDPTIDLDPRRFAASEIGAFLDAANYSLIGIRTLSAKTVRPRLDDYPFQVVLPKRATARVALRRVGTPRQFELGRRDTVGTWTVSWRGLLGDSVATDGVYEVLAVVPGVSGAASDTARRFFRVTAKDSAGPRLRITPDSTL